MGDVRRTGSLICPAGHGWQDGREGPELGGKCAEMEIGE